MAICTKLVISPIANGRTFSNFEHSMVGEVAFHSYLLSSTLWF